MYKCEMGYEVGQSLQVVFFITASILREICLSELWISKAVFLVQHNLE